MKTKTKNIIFTIRENYRKLNYHTKEMKECDIMLRFLQFKYNNDYLMVVDEINKIKHKHAEHYDAFIKLIENNAVCVKELKNMNKA